VENEAIPRANVDYIASKVLKNCNFIHTKSKNNNTRIKKGSGKMMITSGLTLDQFKEKYHVK
jgi:hypothetical protein